VWHGEPVDRPIGDERFGEVLDVVDREGIDIRSGDGAIRIRRVQPDDRPSRWADRYADEADLSPGESVGRECAPDNWLYTGIRGPTDPTSFDTNLPLGTTGAFELVAFSGFRHTLQAQVILDRNQIFKESIQVEDTYRETVEYTPTEPGTHSIRAEFHRDDERVDARHLKVFVHSPR
jgi:hypothetical protein